MLISSALILIIEQADWHSSSLDMFKYLKCEKFLHILFSYILILRERLNINEWGSVWYFFLCKILHQIKKCHQFCIFFKCITRITYPKCIIILWKNPTNLVDVYIQPFPQSSENFNVFSTGSTV